MEKSSEQQDLSDEVPETEIEQADLNTVSDIMVQAESESESESLVSAEKRQDESTV